MDSRVKKPNLSANFVLRRWTLGFFYCSTRTESWQKQIWRPNFWYFLCDYCRELINYSTRTQYLVEKSQIPDAIFLWSNCSADWSSSLTRKQILVERNSISEAIFRQEKSYDRIQILMQFRHKREKGLIAQPSTDSWRKLAIFPDAFIVVKGNQWIS